MRQSHQNSSGDASPRGGCYKVEQQRSVCIFLPIAHHIRSWLRRKSVVGGKCEGVCQVGLEVWLEAAEPLG